MYKVKLKGMGIGRYCPDGVWLTKEQLDFVSKAQYDDDLRDRVRNLGGRWFAPSAFQTVLEEKELKEVVQNSPNCNKDFLESLAEDGYIDEVCKACRGSGWSSVAQNLLKSGKYKALGTGETENEPSINQANLKKLQEMKSRFGVGSGND